MENISLGDFIAANRDELIHRCQEKVAARFGKNGVGDRESSGGIPLFLDQLVDELGDAPSRQRDTKAAAIKHGAALFLDGFTVGQVVHDYGDVCQSITDLAVEAAAAIRSEDFRTLNGCLDDAIAVAVAEHARQQRFVVDGASSNDTLKLRSLIEAAITGYEALQSGMVGISGTTGALVYRSLLALRAAV